MAKCVRMVGQGVPVRMSNEDAFRIVHNEKGGEYCSKSFWKEWYKKLDQVPYSQVVIERPDSRYY